ncbi:DUF1534 domain-containing protein [Pseudomonas syringae pv. tomato]|nr:DUF1534 domain-containing protein [Pseudomonas syringae]TES69701.1 DUF1534 domain-containing protein [Pseudomonas syringae pv. tomato]
MPAAPNRTGHRAPHDSRDYRSTLQPRHLSFLTLQRRNALGDALRHKSAPRRVFRTGRRASRTACRRGASHDSHPWRQSSPSFFNR